jgi:hypothetical protein
MRASIFAVAVATLLARSASAQFQPVTLDTRSPPPPFLLTAPIRLTLQNGLVPMAGGYANCASREDAAGNSVGGIPVSFQQGVALTPRLTLAAFSQLGCPIDGSIGGVVAFTTPLRASLALVISGGIVLAPGQLQTYGGLANTIIQQVRGRPSATGAAARADLVWKTSSGRTFNVGVGSTGTRHTLTFGGGF